MSTVVWVILTILAVLLASFVFSVAVGKWLKHRSAPRDNGCDDDDLVVALMLKLPDFSSDIAAFREEMAEVRAACAELPAIRELLEQLLEEARK